MKLLLDTHIVIWVLENNKALSAYHKSLIADTNNETAIEKNMRIITVDEKFKVYGHLVTIM